MVRGKEQWPKQTLDGWMDGKKKGKTYNILKEVNKDILSQEPNTEKKVKQEIKHRKI